MLKRAIFVSCLVVLAAGCFPITASVSPDGSVALVREEGVVVCDLKANTAKVIVKPAEGMKAAWAEFSKDGKQVMYVLAEGDQPKDVYVCKADGSGAKKIYSAGNAMAYARWSPDGKYVTAGEVSQQSKNNLPNLINVKLITVATGEAKALVDDTTQVHAWTSDSTGVVALVLEGMVGKEAKGDKKENDDANGGGQETKAPKGKLVRIGLDGTKTTLAEVIVGKNPCVDVSHDGKTVLFTASAATAEMERGYTVMPTLPAKPDEAALYSYTFADKKVTRLCEPDVESAFFSPDDKHILMARGGESKDLAVTDASGKNPVTVATDAINATEGMDATRVLPTWLSNDTVIYWRTKVVIGLKGQSIVTMTAKIDGSKKMSIQSKLDSLLEK